MLTLATKYSPLPTRSPSETGRPSPPADRSPSSGPRGEGAGLPEHGSAEKPVPVLKAPWWQEAPAAMASRVAQMLMQESQRRCGVQILVPTWRKLLTHREWRFRELREGGQLLAYLRAKRYQTPERWRAAARMRQEQGFRQNPRSDIQLLATVPAYDYHRWRRVDKHFWQDEKNLKKLRQDNPTHIGSIYV